MSARKCACGCGQIVNKTYAQGHDARHRGQLLRKFREGRTSRERQAAARILREKGWDGHGAVA